ncbi:MAG: 5'-3' exonuclease [Myxococcota bacterium]|jgi:5'-3' exonuclease
MKLHLVDGTYELFRAFFGAPPASGADGQEVGATRGVLRTIMALLSTEGATHVAVAFDTVIESFRNEMFDGYKTGAGIDPKLWSQFPLIEEGCRALGVTVWSMHEFEADDAIGAAAHRFKDDVEQVVICTPDKDMAQCVITKQVVCLDRRREITLDFDGVIGKFGVEPESIPDWLGLVGDAADGIPGIPRWGAKSAATVLMHYKHIENIPDDVAEWTVKVRGAAGLAKNLAEAREDAMLYRKLATLRLDVPLSESLEDMRWKGPNRAALTAFCDRIAYPQFVDRVPDRR